MEGEFRLGAVFEMLDIIVRGSSDYGFTDTDICPSFLQQHKPAQLFCSHGIKFLADMNQSYESYLHLE